MAVIIPFRAWRYNRFLSKKIYDLTAPLSETKFQQVEEALYQEPFHNFHIASPFDVPPFENVVRRVENWKLDKVVEQDPAPSFYAYSQVYKLNYNGKWQTLERSGLIALIRTADYAEKVILPHENTFAQVVDFRTTLLGYTEMHTTPTHGLYTDPDQVLSPILSAHLQTPLAEVVDVAGVTHRLAAISDPQIITQCQQLLANKPVFIADGHHRYESSLRFAKAQKQHRGSSNIDLLSDYHLMWLTNTEPEDLGILPTHRLLKGLNPFDEKAFLARLEQYFEIEPLPEAEKLIEIVYEKPWEFGLILPNQACYLRLKPESFQQAQKEWQLPPEVKNLDLSVMHYFIFEKALHINPFQQFDYIDFAQDSQDCIEQVKNRKCQAAILTHRIPLRSIQEVSLAGYTMPAKSTYFYPKVLSGLVFASVKPNEA